MTRRDARHPLPEWVTESVPSMFPAATALQVDNESGPAGVSLYGGGLDKVIRQLPRLSHVIHTVRVTFTSRNVLVPLVWAGLKHCALESGPLRVVVEVLASARPSRVGFFLPVFHWQTVEEESHELEAVLKARVRKVTVVLNVRHERGAGNQQQPPAFPSHFSCVSSFSPTAWSLLTRFHRVKKVCLRVGEGVSCDRDMLLACLRGLGFAGYSIVRDVSDDNTMVFQRGR